MQNLINWILGNKKYIVSYRLFHVGYTDRIENELIWCENEDNLLREISVNNKIRSSQIENIYYLELPSFSRGVDYLNHEKKSLK